MIIDCGSCAMRNIACHECVVQHLLEAPGPAPLLELAPAEEQALTVLQEAGLVPRLRLATG